MSKNSNIGISFYLGISELKVQSAKIGQEAKPCEENPVLWRRGEVKYRKACSYVAAMSEW